METTSARYGAFLEWVVAAAFLVSMLTGGYVAVDELRTVRPITPVIAREALAPVPPAAVPPRVVSIPVLLLPDNREIRVGDVADAAIQVLGLVDSGTQAAERGPLGDRVTRFFEYRRMKFILVVEPLEQGGVPRVSAIYLPER